MSLYPSEWTSLITFLAVAGGCLGLLIGSFLNVVAYRVPNRVSIVSPPSACPRCGNRIRAYDNVPVLSWLVLGGKCRDCREPISARYPLVEALTGVFFVAVAVRFLAPVLQAGDGAGPSARSLVAALIELSAYLYFAAISVALALIDIDTHRLPDRIVLPSYVVGIVLLGGAAVLSQDIGALLSALAGGAVLVAVYLALALIRPGGMGLGDVKLAGAIGILLGYLGLGPLLVGAFGAFLLGGLFSIVLLALRRAGRRSGIPFGPWMLAGAWIGIFAGDALWRGYLAVMGLA